jgi:hypothetical protein
MEVFVFGSLATITMLSFTTTTVRRSKPGKEYICMMYSERRASAKIWRHMRSQDVPTDAIATAGDTVRDSCTVSTVKRSDSRPRLTLIFQC